MVKLERSLDPAEWSDGVSLVWINWALTNNLDDPWDLAYAVKVAFLAYQDAGRYTRWEGRLPKEIGDPNMVWIPGVALYLVLEIIGVKGASLPTQDDSALWSLYGKGREAQWASLPIDLRGQLSWTLHSAWELAGRLCGHQACLAELMEVVDMSVPSCKALRDPPPGAFIGVYLDVAMAVTRLGGMSLPALEDAMGKGASEDSWRAFLLHAGYSESDLLSLEPGHAYGIDGAARDSVALPSIEEVEGMVEEVTKTLTGQV